MAKKRYDAVVFDIGGTLVRCGDPVAAALRAIAHLGAPSLEDYNAAVRRVVNEWHASGGRPEHEDLRETWLEHNRRALLMAGFEGDAGAAARLFYDAFLLDGLAVFPDALEPLGALRTAGYKLGVVSNWPDSLEATLGRLGLAHFFPVVVASGMVGYRKPNPRIFHVAVERMGVHPSRALYVGDHVEFDGAGARAAGMDVVLIARDESSPNGVPVLRSLVDLPDFVRLQRTGALP